jgi:hypothetical protein
MNISKGWTTEYARQRFSVTVDESDLLSMLVEAGLDPAKVVLKEDEKFSMLDLEADRFSLTTAVRAGVVSKEDGDLRMQEYLGRRANILRLLAEFYPNAVLPAGKPALAEPSARESASPSSEGD